MGFLFNIKEATYKWLGVGFIILGLIEVVSSIDRMRDPKTAPLGYETLGMCVPVIFIIGILFIYVGLRAEREVKGYEKLAAYLKAYRRIKIPALASKLKLSEYETERRIIKCMRLRLLSGYMDRASDEFFNEAGMEGKALITCPQCGGPVEQVVIAGETGKCPYCGSLLAAAK